MDDFIGKYKDRSIQLKDVTEKIFAPPLFKHIYLNKDNGYPFMTGSELTQFNLRYYRWLSPRGVKDINDYVVRKAHSFFISQEQQTVVFLAMFS